MLLEKLLPASKQTVPRLGVDQTELMDLLASHYCSDSLSSLNFHSNKNTVIFYFIYFFYF